MALNRLAGEFLTFGGFLDLDVDPVSHPSAMEGRDTTASGLQTIPNRREHSRALMDKKKGLMMMLCIMLLPKGFLNVDPVIPENFLYHLVEFSEGVSPKGESELRDAAVTGHPHPANSATFHFCFPILPSRPIEVERQSRSEFNLWGFFPLFFISLLFAHPSAA